jgi:hypothetical protein
MGGHSGGGCGLVMAVGMDVLFCSVLVGNAPSYGAYEVGYWLCVRQKAGSETMERALMC